MHLILLCLMAAAVAGRPSFIAVPADQIAFVDLSALHVRRVPRQALQTSPPQLPQAFYDQDYQPIPIHQYPQQQVALAPPTEPQRLAPAFEQPQDASSGLAQLAERPPDFGEYVDFGAHTGDNGAFGWYADYPVNNHDDSGYRK